MTTNSLLQGLNASTRTTNGMRANATTFSKNVDLFFDIGASRGKDLSAAFAKAMAEDANVAVRILQWARDVRGGAGERQVFRTILKGLAKNVKTQAVASALLPKVPEIGRWDDLLELMDTPLEADAAYFIGEALVNKNGLAAKWMPRKGEVAVKLRRYWALSPKQYRKLLVALTNVVETKMCAKEWDTIQFDKLPSLAAARYQKAFGRNAESAYAVYKAGLEKGTTTINAGAVYPYDVLKSVVRGDEVVANAQWKALPDYLQGSTENLVVVADVSGSMTCPVGDNPNVTCMDVCISLAMYISERSRGAFQDAFITFARNPRLQYLTGKTLGDRYRQLERADWDTNTNMIAVFDQVLDTAVARKVPESDMPTTILVMSDMQFDVATGGRHGKTLDGTAVEEIRNRYEAFGYKMPKLVFWNLNANPKTAPATVNDAGVALVSGCSPSLLKSILGGKDFSPESMMLETVMVDRYNWQ